MKKQLHLYIIAIFLTGLISGLAAAFLRYSINFIHDLLFYGQLSFHDHYNLDSTSQFPNWYIIIMPVIGSLIVSFLIKQFAPKAKGHGIPEVMFSIRQNKFSIKPGIAFIRAIAATISIGSGGSAGTEGPIVQLSAAIGLIQTLYTKHLSDIQKATLLACGASAGLAATFNAPLAGVFFSMELLLPVITLSTLIPVIASTSTAIIVSHLIFGDNIFFQIDITSISNEFNLNSYMLLGCIMGIASACFITILDKFEIYFEELKYSAFIKHAFGMFVVGIILYTMFEFTGEYYVSGEGFISINKMLNNQINGYSFLLLILFFLKLLVTCLTLGSGGAGGIFIPSLFMGASLGGYYYIMAQNIFVTLESQPLNFVIAGMTGMLAGTTGALLTAVIILLETTHCYYLAFPLITTALCATATKYLLVRDSIYHLKLNQKMDIMMKSK